MSDGPYTNPQLRVLTRLPASTNELADALDIETDTAYSRLRRIDEHEDKVDIRTRESEDGEVVYFSDDPEHVAQISSRHKQTVTRHANERLQELELDLAKVLRTTDGTAVDVSVPSAAEDFVIHRSDTHIGQVVYDDRGRQIFNTEVAVEREQRVTEAVIAAADERRQYRDLGAAHLLLGGDICTNENIYDHQPFHIDRTLDEQIIEGVELWYGQVCRLAEEFEKVQVVCQPGNHGEIRADGMSKKANADRIVYAALDLLVRLAGPENVHVVRSDATNYVNFEMRGWRGHLRHGQTMKEHVGTASPNEDWLFCKDRHEFDLAYWGHYHEPLHHHVNGARCIRSGSVCPPDDFEESIAAWSAPAAFVHTVSDEDRMSWSKPIRFD